MKLLRWLTLLPGRRVMVYLINGTMHTGRVHDIGWRSVVLSYYVHRHYPGRKPKLVRGGVVVRARADEGLSWCRGWKGPAVAALRVAIALR